MTANEFRNLLEGAISRDMDSLEELISLYSPLIDKMSRVNGQIDEDLRQHLLLHIALHISRFRI